MFKKLFCLLLLVLALAVPVRNIYAEPSASRVLVVYNSAYTGDEDHDGTQDSLQVANYYMQRRGVPSGNILGIAFSGDEYVNGSTEMQSIATAIKNKLNTLGVTNIDIILYSYHTPWKYGNASLDNVTMGINWLGGSTMNPYFEYNPTFGTDKGRFDHSYKVQNTHMYLVSRLDGSGGLLRIMDIVDQCIYAERYLAMQQGYFTGNVYIDSRGDKGFEYYTDAQLTADPDVQNGSYGTYAAADVNVAYGEHYVRGTGLGLKWERSGSLIGDAGTVFEDGTPATSAPAALFYGGWYSYGTYNDVYQWLPGSVGVDLDSINFSYPIRGRTYPAWGIQALAHGLTNAVGVVAEPYLSGHPRPNVLIHYLLQGFSFAEASALSNPQIGWTSITIGDPLYTPFKTKTLTVDTTPPAFASGYPKLTQSNAEGNTIDVVASNAVEPEVVKVTVRYGTTTNYDKTTTTTNFQRRHKVTLQNLQGGTLYHYAVTLVDPAGHSATSEDLTFTTPVRAPYGGTAPSIPSVIQVEDFDEGGEGVAYHDSDPTVYNPSYGYRKDTGVDILTTDAGGKEVLFTAPGEWLEYTFNAPQAGTYTITERVNTYSGTGGKFHIEIDGVNVTGTVTITAADNTQTGINISAGQHVMRLVMDAGSPGQSVLYGDVGSFDYITFALTGAPSPTPTPTPTPTPSPSPTPTPTPTPTPVPTPTPTPTPDKATISGRFIQSNGQPLAGALVLLKTTTEKTYKQYTKQDGSFSFLVPNGLDYAIVPVASEYWVYEPCYKAVRLNGNSSGNNFVAIPSNAIIPTSSPTPTPTPVPSPVSGVVPSGADLQAVIDSAPCGSRITLQESGVYLGNLHLRNKGCTTDTLITTATVLPASGTRVTPTYFSKLAKILAPGNGLPAIDSDAGASMYRFEGVEIGVDYTKGGGSSFLIVIGNGNDSNPNYGSWLAHDIKFDRVHVAGKFGDSRFAFAIAGERVTIINSWIDEFANPPGGDSCALWFSNAGGHTVENNYISAGMWNVFMGGADSDSPNRATVTNPTLTQATFTNMEGVAPRVGDLLAFYIRTSNTESTWSANTVYSAGTVQYHHSNWTREVGRPPLMFYTVSGGTSGITQPDWNAFDEYQHPTQQDGTVTWKLFNGDYQVAKVTSVSGNTISYTPEGPTGLYVLPVANSLVRWNGYNPSVVFRRNHFHRPASWAQYNASDKGMVQIKNGVDTVFESNVFSSDAQWPGMLSLTPGNQAYSAPWSTARNITIRNNFARHLTGLFNFALIDYVKTNIAGGGVIIDNNLAIKIGGKLLSDGTPDPYSGGLWLGNNAHDVTWTHNTFHRTGRQFFAYGGVNQRWLYQNNIDTMGGTYNYCESGEPWSTRCFTGTFTPNLIVNLRDEDRATWPSGNFFEAGYGNVGFANLDGSSVSDWKLSTNSIYRNRATDGKDLGVDTTQLMNAIAGVEVTFPIGIRSTRQKVKLNTALFKTPSLDTLIKSNLPQANAIIPK